jgi:hypothetical protein
VEVKTGTAPLRKEQIDAYLDIARTNGFDAVVTISNDIAGHGAEHPVDIDRPKLRRIGVQHTSWAEIHALAERLRAFGGIADATQSRMADEFVRYLGAKGTGTSWIHGMGEHWAAVRDALSAGTLRRGDRGVVDVVRRWEALVRYVGIGMGMRLGVDVTPVVSRRLAVDPSARLAAQVGRLVDHGQLVGVLKIPAAAAPMTLRADLRTRRVWAESEIAAPQVGKPLTRVNWLLRQLADAPGELRIESVTPGRLDNPCELLSKAKGAANLLVREGVEPRAFELSLAGQMGPRRGSGRDNFVDSVLAVADAFYDGILRELKPWVPTPPRMVDLPAEHAVPEPAAAVAARA